MNRSERRRLERQKKRVQQDLQRQILRQAEKQLNDGRVEAMMVCMALGLRREFGFGKERVLRALKAVDDLMDPWIRGDVSLDDMRKQVIDEVGIDIKC